MKELDIRQTIFGATPDRSSPDRHPDWSAKARSSPRIFAIRLSCSVPCRAENMGLTLITRCLAIGLLGGAALVPLSQTRRGDDFEHERLAALIALGLGQFRTVPIALAFGAWKARRAGRKRRSGYPTRSSHTRLGRATMPAVPYAISSPRAPWRLLAVRQAAWQSAGDVRDITGAG